jgi:hypothetical protein
LSCCFFLNQKKSFLSSLFFAKKKYNKTAKGFSLQSGLEISTIREVKVENREKKNIDKKNSGQKPEPIIIFSQKPEATYSKLLQNQS